MAPPPHAAATGGAVAARPASDAAPAVTVEEARLDRDVPRRILADSGFDGVAPAFATTLRGAGSYGQAERAAVRHGERLWQRAVDRAQGRGPAGGELSRDDDRPLYWARLAMTRELRAWHAESGLSDAAGVRLLERLESTSRGQESLALGGGDRAGERDRERDRAKGVKRIVVTGFDPFTLDRDIRISNPSGALALALDGTVIRTADGPARVETAVFPVRWGDFADGTVERALRRALPRADLFVTVSQGRVGRIDVERYNGAWRGGFGDNENVSETGLVPVKNPATQPQWTRTTLPYAGIVAAGTGRFPVYDNTSVTEIPAGAAAPVVRPDGPTPGSAARAGGGGDYLSNEIAYRATLLRDRLGLDIPGGHVHTPVLQFGPDNTDPATGSVTDPVFVQNRLDITEQLREIVRVAAEES
ncbi:pyroglutamyl peptidase [Streptomyces sp. IB2014 016-6]|uniref:pyroglutamyl peptidase n=1 Tax=Streptomyces sp. IB2014 016-6 TaxID=2517818 RepID=UPI001F4F3A91|nr:pyroglutamyl peptidase [Streptomyces sp. IB2014 016-6]